MNHVVSTPVRVRHRPKLRLVQVLEAERISPAIRRITFTGEALADFESLSPDDHVKLFFPQPGQERPALPVLGAAGLVYEDGAAPPAVRDYTPRRFDAATRTLVIEFVLHGDGPASCWAEQAAAGQWIGVGGPKSSSLIPDDYDVYLLAGDESALPAIGRFLEEMRPGVRALVLAEVADAREIRHLPTAANAAVTWLTRDGAPAGDPSLLEGALKNLMLPQGSIHAWMAGEIEVMRRLRDYLVAEEGFSRAQIRAAGYWRLGDAGAHARLDD
jgi:NADPH-dependent ferric siderophore reductase